MSRLTILSFGGGQDSTAILYGIEAFPDWREKLEIEDFAVVMSDTGDEHPATLQHVAKISQWCQERGIHFAHLTPDKGFHSPSWISLRDQYERSSTVGMKAGKKSCTDQLKIRPIYRWLESYISERYGIESKNSGHGKPATQEFARRHGKVKVLIGIAKGEERRIAKPDDSIPLWRQNSIEIAYPLVDFGLDRQGCQDLISGLGYHVPPPSNCILCPFMSKVELLWLARTMPEQIAIWERFENRKLEKYAARGTDPKKNHGVWGRKRIREVLNEAEVEFGHMTYHDLNEYKMSHGHCVSSKY